MQQSLENVAKLKLPDPGVSAVRFVNISAA